ncbi:MAG: FtsQ-type POTRA domain-containing protein [Treponema sp.]|jgi:cell division protein FtsQ|nr:FtsQ-type POTRA domain-containing protein [Treponema sp.]
MSDNYLYAEDPVTTEAVKENSAPGMEKWLKILIFVVALALGGELIWLFGIKAMMPLSSVEVAGIPGIDRTAILAQAGIGSHSTYITVNSQAVKDALEELYQVGSAKVIKRYPDRLQILLEPRRPAAMALITIGDRLRPVYFDKHGVVIKIGNSGRDGPAVPTLPLISGLGLEGAFLGMKLHPQFEALFSRLEKISAVSPELLASVSEIHINWKTYSGYDLILYPIHQQIRFRLESDLNDDMLRYMLLMIDIFSSQSVTVDEVDLRTGTASYIKKEAYSG